MLELDPETERRNMLLGWALFVAFVVLLVGVVIVAFVYLAVA
jgi:hypothetical protein